MACLAEVVSRENPPPVQRTRPHTVCAQGLASLAALSHLKNPFAVALWVQHSARTVPVQFPYSARTVPIRNLYSARTFLIMRI